MACLLESVVMTLPIVAVVVENLDPMLCGVILEGMLSGLYFLGLSIDLEVDKAHAAEMVNKDGGAFVVLFGKFALQSRVKSHFS